MLLLCEIPRITNKKGERKMEKKNEKKLTPIQIVGFALEVQRTHNTGMPLNQCVKEVKEAEKEARAR